MNATERKSIYISPSSVFGDTTWDLTYRDPTRTRHEMVLPFMALFPTSSDLAVADGGLLESLQLFAYSLLTDPPAPNLHLSNIVRLFRRGGLVNLVRFMSTERLAAFSEITPALFSEFLLGEQLRPHPSGLEITDQTLKGRVRGIHWLVTQSPKLADGLGFHPWQEFENFNAWAEAAAQLKVSRDSLKTPVISDELISEIVLASIETLKRAEPLIRAIEAWQQHSRLTSEVPPRRRVKGKFVNSSDVLSTFSFKQYGFRNFFQMHRQYVDFRAAVALLIGMFTGMRPNEILSIPGAANSCIQEDIEIDGKIVRCFFVQSVLRKNVPSPTSREWQTVPIVVEAIDKLTAANEAIGGMKPTWLFRSIKERSRGGHNNDGRRLSPTRLNTSIKRFLRGNAVDDGQTMSGYRLRRAFARLAARNGMGKVELKDQLKHFDINVTTLYGKPGLAQSLHEGKRNWTEEVYEELLSGNKPIIGGGAENVERLRGEFRGLTRADKDKFIKNLSHEALIDQVDPGLCMYRPQNALCGGQKANCKPAECHNSVIPVDSAIKSYQNRKSENQRLLSLTARDTPRRAFLLKQIATNDKLLEQAKIKLVSSEEPQNG